MDIRKYLKRSRSHSQSPLALMHVNQPSEAVANNTDKNENAATLTASVTLIDSSVTTANWTHFLF